MESDCYFVAARLFEAFVTKSQRMPIHDPMETTHTSTARPTRRPRRQPCEGYNVPGLRQGLAYLALLVPAYGYSQSFVGGDLSNQAPYGLPAQDFAAAIAAPSSNASVKITGYNTSLAAGAIKATENPIDGWLLNIGVTANVPLITANNDGVDKNLCIDATSLSITPPAQVATYNSSAWRVCAIVFTDGLADGASTKTDGSCSAALSNECITQLQSNSVAGHAGRGGRCQDLDVPTSCVGHFIGKGHGTGFGEYSVFNSLGIMEDN